LEAGARVCISDINEKNGEASLDELKKMFGQDRVHFISCDVTKTDDLRTLFDETEKFFNVSCIDILVNNAGINVNFGWKKCLDVNIMAVINGTEIAMDRMKKVDKQCQIISTASAASFAPGVVPKMMPYTVTKHGVVAMMRTLAMEDTNIMHKVICPAWADTQIMSGFDEDPVSRKTREAQINRFGGLMTPEYVAEGFFQLVTKGGNGSCMLVLNNTPYLMVPEHSKSFILMVVAISKIIDKIISPSVVTGYHLAFTSAFLFLGLCYLITLVF